MDLLNAIDASSKATIAVARAITPNQLDRPTPCGEWNVQQLLNHMIGSFEYFVARAEGKDATRPQPASPASFDETIERVTSTAADAATAWRRPGALDQTIVTSFGEVKGAFVCNITLTELLMHGWDLAKATDQRLPFDDTLAEDILANLKPNMLPPARQTAFGPEKGAPEGAPAVDRLAAFLGREV